MSVRVSQEAFGSWDGKMVNRYTIAEQNGISVGVMNYGAAITAIDVADCHGISANIVLGFDKLEGYLQSPDMYIGSVCGRFANRIGKARFAIADKLYQLPANNHGNCLHGGSKGFDKVYWEAAVLEGEGVRFLYNSSDGEAGFPGNLAVTVDYTVADNALTICYAAQTDQATPVNLTSHAYFNLSGGVDADIFNHQLQLHAHQYLDVCNCQVPTGRLLDVGGTDMDFGQMRGLAGSDYDHCWVLGTSKTGTLKSAAMLVHPGSGRAMEVLTTEPGIHCYTGSSLSSSSHRAYQGLCLEAQHFPDSPNHPHFPNTILQPGDVYQQKTVYRFFNNFSKK